MEINYNLYQTPHIIQLGSMNIVRLMPCLFGDLLNFCLKFIHDVPLLAVLELESRTSLGTADLVEQQNEKSIRLNGIIQH